MPVKKDAARDRYELITDEEFVKEIAEKSPEERYLLLCNERHRFRTLAAKFDVDDAHDITMHATQGFFYDACASKIVCVFCGVENDHQSDCPKINGGVLDNEPFYEPGGLDYEGDAFRLMYKEMKLDAKAVSPDDIFVQNVDSSGVISQQKVVVDRPKISTVVKTQARYKEYMSRKKREDSFKDETAREAFKGKERLVELMIDAGFFYKGPHDNVICFFCDGSLEEWLADDVPWQEHVNFYYRCPFLRQCKGMDYIWDVRNRMSLHERSENDRVIYTQGDFTTV